MEAQYGPHAWEVCSACNFNVHRCPGCGTDLTHAEAQRGGHCSERFEPKAGKWAWVIEKVWAPDTTAGKWTWVAD